MITSASQALDWLGQYRAGIEVVVWLLGLLAVGFAGLQLSESRKQRGLTESFTLVEKLNASLDAWRTEAERPSIVAADFGRRLADVLTNFEIVCDGINRGYLTKMARETLTHQILGNLKNVYEHKNTAAAHRFLCDDPAVCGAFKIFLLNHHSRVRRHDATYAAFDAIFSANDRRLMDGTFVSFLERRIVVLRLWLGGRE